MDHWRNQRNKKIPGDKWKWKKNNSKFMGCSKSSSKREVNSGTSLPQETRKIWNKWLNPIPKGTGGKKNKQNSRLVDGKK